LAALFSVGESRAEAIRLERFIKKQKSRKFIELLVKGDRFDGVLAQLVRVPHVRD